MSSAEAVKAIQEGRVLLYMQEDHARSHMQLFPGARPLGQDRTVDMVEDVMKRLPPPSGQKHALIAVGPPDKIAELSSRLQKERPDIILVVAQVHGRAYEQLTGRPYNPKENIEPDVLRKVLRLYVVTKGEVRHYNSVADMLQELDGKKVAVFNDVMRQSLETYAKELGYNIVFLKTCDGADCVQINALGDQPSYRISFPPTVGRLTAEEMVQHYKQGTARAYWSELQTVDITAQALPPASVSAKA